MMDKTERLQHRKQEFQEQWDLLRSKLSGIEREQILENRSEEIFRLDQQIAGLKEKRKAVEEELEGAGLNPLIGIIFLAYCFVIMKQYIEIRCRRCGADDLAKNGRNENGTQRYRCNECGKNFRMNTIRTPGNLVGGKKNQRRTWLRLKERPE